jgi:hypothetical protein
MLIIENPKQQNKLTFEDLEIGDVFLDKADDVCMKVDNTRCYNAVLLESGELIAIAWSEKVTRVNAILAIEREG